MKKMNTLLTMGLTAIMTLTMLTACGFEFGVYDDDPYYRDDYDSAEARTLDGTWTGYIDAYYRDRFGLSGDSYRTTMYFERENHYGGWGYEVDYNMNSRYNDYYYCKFRWEVIDGNVRIQYADSWNDVWIYNYQLDSYYFSGQMDDGVGGSRIRFQLRYDGSFDWSFWTRGYTRSADGTGAFKASGAFAAAEEE